MIERVRPLPAVVEARKAEIARRYRRRRKRSAFQMCSIRVAELNRLFEARHGKILPDDETGRECALIVANHLMILPGVPLTRIMDWAKERAPWLTVAEVGDIIASAACRPQTWKADSLAWRLKLTYADRQALKIKTIGAIDCNKRERAQLRKKAARQRMKRLREKQTACAT